MAYTSHGHHIPGTSKGQGVAEADRRIARCMGLRGCQVCKRDAEEYMTSVTGTGEDFQLKAKEIVKAIVDGYYISAGEEPPAYELYLPWFSKTLQNWKATVGTTLPDSKYYELTHDGSKRKTYVDCYYKVDQVIVSD